ncbi:MAG TPA: LuxR C-terminal-related transcriptional regulator [Propionibacteriaceae bacterium]
MHHEAAETSGRAGSLVEIRMLQALAHHAQGQRPPALESLARALAQTPEPGSYVQFFLAEGTPIMSGVCLASGRLPKLRLPAWASMSLRGRQSLSERELQVLMLLDCELSGPQIARELFVAANTLSTHTKHIFTKLGVTSRRAAVLRAREHRLL